MKCEMLCEAKGNTREAQMQPARHDPLPRAHAAPTFAKQVPKAVQQSLMKRCPMLNLLELQQLIAVSELGSFSKAAERFFVSTPTITRSMRHVEAAFGATLFDRDKNKVTLNETGRLAVERARRVLQEADAAVAQVQAFDRSLRTISVVSCAPAPLWDLVPRITQLYPGLSTNTRVADLPATEQALRTNACDIAVLPYRPDDQGLRVRHLMDEQLFVCVKRDHALAGRTSVTLDDLNGFNFLLGSDLGFWSDLCRNRLTASKFLVQGDDFALAEVIRQSSLPCFTTDVAVRMRYRNIGGSRVSIPIEDPEVNVSFYLAAHDSPKVAKLFG